MYVSTIMHYINVERNVCHVIHVSQIYAISNQWVVNVLQKKNSISTIYNNYLHPPSPLFFFIPFITVLQMLSAILNILFSISPVNSSTINNIVQYKNFVYYDQNFIRSNVTLLP